MEEPDFSPWMSRAAGLDGGTSTGIHALEALLEPIHPPISSDVAISAVARTDALEARIDVFESLLGSAVAPLLSHRSQSNGEAKAEPLDGDNTAAESTFDVSTNDTITDDSSNTLALDPRISDILLIMRTELAAAQDRALAAEATARATAASLQCERACRLAAETACLRLAVSTSSLRERQRELDSSPPPADATGGESDGLPLYAAEQPVESATAGSSAIGSGADARDADPSPSATAASAAETTGPCEDLNGASEEGITATGLFGRPRTPAVTTSTPTPGLSGQTSTANTTTTPTAVPCTNPKCVHRARLLRSRKSTVEKEADDLAAVAERLTIALKGRDEGMEALAIQSADMTTRIRELEAVLEEERAQARASRRAGAAEASKLRSAACALRSRLAAAQLSLRCHLGQQLLLQQRTGTATSAPLTSRRLGPSKQHQHCNNAEHAALHSQLWDTLRESRAESDTWDALRIRFDETPVAPHNNIASAATAAAATAAGVAITQGGVEAQKRATVAREPTSVPVAEARVPAAPAAITSLEDAPAAAAAITAVFVAALQTPLIAVSTTGASCPAVPTAQLPVASPTILAAAGPFEEIAATAAAAAHGGSTSTSIIADAAAHPPSPMAAAASVAAADSSTLAVDGSLRSIATGGVSIVAEYNRTSRTVDLFIVDRAAVPPPAPVPKSATTTATSRPRSAMVRSRSGSIATSQQQLPQALQQFQHLPQQQQTMSVPSMSSEYAPIRLRPRRCSSGDGPSLPEDHAPSYWAQLQPSECSHVNRAPEAAAAAVASMEVVFPPASTSGAVAASAEAAGSSSGGSSSGQPQSPVVSHKLQLPVVSHIKISAREGPTGTVVAAASAVAAAVGRESVDETRFSPLRNLTDEGAGFEIDPSFSPNGPSESFPAQKGAIRTSTVRPGTASAAPTRAPQTVAEISARRRSSISSGAQSTSTSKGSGVSSVAPAAATTTSRDGAHTAGIATTTARPGSASTRKGPLAPPSHPPALACALHSSARPVKASFPRPVKADRQELRTAVRELLRQSTEKSFGSSSASEYEVG